MTEDFKQITETVPPVPVTVIGTGDGLVPNTKAITPADQPNIVIRHVIDPVVALLVRFIHTYVGMVVGLLTAAMMDSDVIPAADFWSLFVKCAGLALGGAIVLSMKDIVTIFGKLEGKYPLLTGGV